MLGRKPRLVLLGGNDSLQAPSRLQDQVRPPGVGAVGDPRPGSGSAAGAPPPAGAVAVPEDVGLAAGPSVGVIRSCSSPRRIGLSQRAQIFIG
ncbi:hypothetical protein C0L86_21415 [Streptomyces sp. SCA2-2]|nr:hypothetical protein C0L86_21415 [Streptomyces sp. SCA2-2]